MAVTLQIMTSLRACMTAAHQLLLGRTSAAEVYWTFCDTISGVYRMIENLSKALLCNWKPLLCISLVI